MLQRQIDILGEQVGDSIFASLLLIRQFAREDIFQPLFFTEQDSKNRGSSLRELMPDNQSCDYIASIAELLTFLEPSLPFVQELIRRNERENVEEEVLRRLICFLSDASIRDIPSALLYEYHFQRKAVTGQAKPGDFYTPREVAQCLAALLNPSL